MVHPTQVHQLVHQDVVPHGRWHQHQPPIQADVAIAAAGAPARTLVANADAGDGKAMDGCELEEACRQLPPSLFTEQPTVLDRRRLLDRARPLTRDPNGMTLRERLRLAPRASARNGHAQSSIDVDAQDVAARAAMPYEICQFNGFKRFNGCTGFEWCSVCEGKSQLHRWENNSTCDPVITRRPREP